MTAKFFRGPVALLVFIVAISAGASVSWAQYDDPMPQPPMQQPSANPAPKQAAPKVNKAEEDGYKALYAARTGPPAGQVQLAEDFIKKFPMSHYLPAVNA